MRSEEYRQPGSVITFRMPRGDHEVYTQEAADSVVGQCPPFIQPDGTRHHSEVLAARVEGIELLLTLRIGDPETGTDH